MLTARTSNNLELKLCLSNIFYVKNDAYLLQSSLGAAWEKLLERLAWEVVGQEGDLEVVEEEGA